MGAAILDRGSWRLRLARRHVLGVAFGVIVAGTLGAYAGSMTAAPSLAPPVMPTLGNTSWKLDGGC